MKKVGGWIGRIIRIDLSTQSVTKKSIKEEQCLKYIGGRGFASKVLFEELDRVATLTALKIG